ncbi:MAG TPA: DUF4147 domain-containing protein [Kofleriaceae bacterium]
MIARAVCEDAFREAVRACDPARLVREELAAHPLGRRDVYALAIGKAALAMARGAGPVARGLAVAPQLDGAPLPLGWTARDAAHPEPDARSLAAGEVAIELVESAGPGDVVLALMSGGASALVEQPAPGVTPDQLRDDIRELMHHGAEIHAINAERVRLSAIKGGKLARRSRAPVVTLAISDVYDDDIAVIGSGPMIARRAGDRQRVIAPMRMFAEAMRARLGLSLYAMGSVLVTTLEIPDGVVAWGEPTVQVPADHGEGGRAQQLALRLARDLRRTDRSAFVAGSDGIDGPPPRGRPAPAGAYVDGSTWDAIAAAGLDPQRALDRCDAGPALAAVGALFVTGPTGINHADVAVVA